MHKFRIEALFRSKWVNYVEMADDPVKAVRQLWNRRPGCSPAVITLLGPVSAKQKSCWTITEITLNREQIIVDFELNGGQDAKRGV